MLWPARMAAYGRFMCLERPVEVVGMGEHTLSLSVSLFSRGLDSRMLLRLSLHHVAGRDQTHTCFVYDRAPLGCARITTALLML